MYPGVLGLFLELDLGPERGADFSRLKVCVRSPAGMNVEVPVRPTDTIADVQRVCSLCMGKWVVHVPCVVWHG